MRLTIVMAVIGLIAVTGRLMSSAHASERSVAPRCPQALATGAYAPEGLLAAVRKELPLAYRDLRNQSGRIVLTPNHYSIVEVLALTPTVPPIAGAARYRMIAERRCGPRVAARSWVLVIDIPEAQTVQAGRGVAFFADTPAGWELWYRYR